MIFATVTISLFLFKLYNENVSSHEIKELSIKYESESIADFLVAFRTTYQDIFIKNHTKLDESNIDFLPVRTTNEIAKIFSELNTQAKIATVSQRPRNPENMANKRQLEVIEHFEKNNDVKSSFKTIEGKHYYSQPLYISQTCLKCHGKKEDAPNIIQKNYDTAYDYKLGELRGIIDIEVSQTKLSILLEANNGKRVFYVIVLLSGILMIAFIYANHNKKLEEKVNESAQTNRMQEQQMLHQSRLAQMGEMISMIAHQWRQPLNAISMTSGNLQFKCMTGDMDSEAFSHELGLIDGYSQHLSKTIDDFRGFFKDNKTKELTTLETVVNSTLDIVRTAIETKNIKIVTSLKCHEPFETYPSEVKQVVLNIIKNAEDVLLEKETKNPRIFIETLCDDKTKRVLVIKDNAGGIPEEIMEKIFDPYFSTKLEKEGTGLGLYMSKTIIEEHCGGRLRISNDEEGAVFTIELPVKGPEEIV